MSFLLDTVAVSEWTKPRPNPGLVQWLAEADEDRLFLSVITLAELRHGVERLPSGQRKQRLDSWLTDDLTARFEARILSVDASIAHAWGKIVARCGTAGRPIGAMDALLAATATVHRAALVTRNVSDFEAAGVAVVNPWEGR